MKNKPTDYDVIIIGGSYAGLSAAMSLGRSLRKVLILDHGQPCNRYTPHSHNFITHDGAVPAAIAQQAKADVLRYPTVEYRSGKAIAVRDMGTTVEAAAGAATSVVVETGSDDGSSAEVDDGSGTESAATQFSVAIESGPVLTCRKVILATGLKDLLPDIPGFAETWGKTVIHCPYCHGYEFRGRKTGILATGEKAMHLAGLVHNLSPDLALLTNGNPELNSEQMAKLFNRRIPIHTQAITALEHQDGQLRQVIFADGSALDLEALYAALPFTQQSDIPDQLGCAITGSGHIQVDAFQQTTVPGVYACGDNASPMRSVASAIASGNLAGAMVNHHLVREDF